VWESANHTPHEEKRDSMSKAEERQKKKIALMNLGMSSEEAEEVLTADDEIDKGKKLFELSAEGKEAEKTCAYIAGVHDMANAVRKAIRELGGV
jgi:hypothetical protein